VVERRAEVLEASGIIIRTSTNIGVDITGDQLLAQYDAVVLTGGSTIPRDLNITGRDANGVHFAMEFLEQKNRQVAGQEIFDHEIISATDKHVVVIGGGDTGADCVGTSNRDKAKSVTQIELLSKPPVNRDESTPWPLWPMQLRNSTSHEEGCDRQWALLTKEFVVDDHNQVTGLVLVDIEWYFDKEQGRSTFKEVEGTTRTIPCDLALLAVGFLHPQHEGILTQLGVKIDNRGNVETQNYQTSIDKVFSAGDMRRGQSLVVWAISEGREAAISVDEYLTQSKSVLNSKSYSKLLV
jgi:glutamate synthase (NADPH/NADH) small chain